MFFKDPLASATSALLDSVREVTAAIQVKKQVVEEALAAVKEANRAIDEAQAALSNRE